MYRGITQSMAQSAIRFGVTTADEIAAIDSAIRLLEADGSHQIMMPLRSRFETVGSVVVMAPNDQVTKRLYASFMPLVYVGVMLSILFAVHIVAA